MENGQKAIMIGVGVFIVVLIISVVIVIVNLGTSTASKSSEKVSGISKSLEQKLVTMYDNKMLSGTDVLYAIETYNEQLDYNIIVGVGKWHNMFEMFQNNNPGAIKIYKAQSIINTVQTVGMQTSGTANQTDLVEKYAFNMSPQAPYVWVFGGSSNNAHTVGINHLYKAVNTKTIYKSRLVRPVADDNMLGIIFIPM